MAALLPRPIRPSCDGGQGYTFIEVMVAMLLTSVMVTSIFSVALTAKTGGGKSDRKLKAAAGARLVASLLKNYVTAEAGTASTSSPNSLPGPGTGPANNWSITGNGITDTCPGGGNSCYALAPGTHTLRGVLGAFENPPYAAYVTYFVTWTAVINGRPVPSVSITVTWTDP